MFRLKILDRYLLREFLRAFGIIVGAFALMMLLKELFGELATLLSYEPPLYAVLVYFVNVLPGSLMEVVPLAVMLSMMFSIGAMAKNKELLAMHAGGISYLRVARPLGVAMLLIAALVFVANERLVPRCEERCRYAEKVLIKGEGRSVISRNKNITTKGKGNRFYTMKSFDSELKRMERPTIMDLAPGGHNLSLRIDAEEAWLVSRQEEHKDADGQTVGKRRRDYWRFNKAVRYTFKNDELERREYFETLEIPMEEDLELFLATNKRDQELNFRELAQLVEVQGSRSKGEYYKSLKTDLHTRLSFPLGIFLLGMVGYTFAVRSSIRSLVFEFGMALLCVVFYYMFSIAGEKFGAMGVVHPVLAAWFTDIVFFSFLVYRFRGLERVPRG